MRRRLAWLYALAFVGIGVCAYTLSTYSVFRDTTSAYTEAEATYRFHGYLLASQHTEALAWLGDMRPVSGSPITFRDVFPYVDREYTWVTSPQGSSVVIRTKKDIPEDLQNAFGIEVIKIGRHHARLTRAGANEQNTVQKTAFSPSWVRYLWPKNRTPLGSMYIKDPSAQTVVFPVSVHKKELFITTPNLFSSSVPRAWVSPPDTQMILGSLADTETFLGAVGMWIPDPLKTSLPPSGIRLNTNSTLMWWDASPKDPEAFLSNLAASYHPQTIERRTTDGHTFKEIRMVPEAVSLTTTHPTNEETTWKASFEDEAMQTLVAHATPDGFSVLIGTDTVFPKEQEGERIYGYATCPYISELLFPDVREAHNIATALLRACQTITLVPSGKQMIIRLE